MSIYELNRAINMFDLAAWAESQGGEALSHAEYILHCPSCGKRKLAVHVDKRSWHCFVCESGGYVGTYGEGKGGLLDLIQLVERRARHEIAESLINGLKDARLPERMPTLKPRAPRVMRYSLPIDWPPWTYAVTHEWYETLPYLRKRGITLEHCNLYRIAVCTQGTYARRVLFPCFEHGQLVSYQARAMYTEAENTHAGRYIKTLNPPKGVTGQGDIVFNLDRARLYPRVALCEGPIDAIHAGLDGVCTFGKRVNDVQIAKMRAAGVKAIDFMWDGPGPTEPEGAWPAMLKAAPHLATFFDVRLVRLPAGDPGEQTTEALNIMRAQAIPWHPNL